MLSFTHRGSFKNIEKFLSKMERREMFAGLNALGQEGVHALAAATPIDSGVTASSWYYEVKTDNQGATISWHNDNVVAGTPLVILLQYGHGTGTGGYVQGRDFINPAIEPIFNRIAEEVWKVVTSA